MADSKANRQAEEWVVANGLPQHFPGCTFESRKMRLTWGGVFAFDAVSDDGAIVALISTSHALTAQRKSAAGKIHKLKSDALYLLHAKGAKQLVMVFTEVSMLRRFQKAKESGRFPPQIDLWYAKLPRSIQEAVVVARKAASEEVSPSKSS